VIILALGVGAITLVVGVAVALLLRSVRSMRLQLTGLALEAVALPLAAVTLSELIMFPNWAKADLVAVSVATAVAGIVGALVLTRDIVGHLERVRTAASELAAGDLTARAPEAGPIELAELASSFNVMAANLEGAFDARSELVAWASHDLRAPISSMRAMLEAIQDGVVEPQHYLDTLQGQVRLLGSLVDDLFEMACINAGATSFTLSDISMGPFVDEFMRGYVIEARHRGVRIHTIVRDDETQTRCAPDKVERVLTNLVTNALRYTPSGGVITASVTSGAGAVFVSIEDSGAGIANEDLERAFEPFWRADQARPSSAGGAGLGLAIARGLITAQGGRIWAEPPGRGGTRICFALPAGDPTPKLAGEVAAVLAPVGSRSPERSGPT
jgi:two-component system sensor histidine kinase BaeS